MTVRLSKKEPTLLNFRKLSILERLKAQSGSITVVEQIDHYLFNTTDEFKTKAK